MTKPESATPSEMRIAVSVGQCGYDDSRLRSFLREIAPGIVIRSTDDLEGTVRELEQGGNTVCLVLVNRLLDRDGSSGIEVIRKLKTKPCTAGIPVMLISNFEDAQANALAEGAMPGFGKSAIGTDSARKRLIAALNIG